MPPISSIGGSTVGFVPIPDFNAYVLSYSKTSGKLFAGSVSCAYAVSTGSIDDFGNHQWVDTSSPTDFSPPRLAYLPIGGGSLGRLFATWKYGGGVVVAELAIAKDANSVISVTGVLQKKTLIGVSINSDPAIAVLGSQLILAYCKSDNSLDMATSNDLVANPGQFTFTPVGGIGEYSSSAPALASSPAQGGMFLAWKGYDSVKNVATSDVSVAGYSAGSSASFFKTTMYGITDDGPGLALANGELYLAYLQQVTKHVCTWPQSDWNRVSARFLGAVTSAPPSLFMSNDASQLVLAYVGIDSQSLANVEFDPF